MELKKLLLETEADRLIDLVQKEPGITPERAAAKLRLPRHTIEVWAEVFSKEGLMSVEYDVRGKMHLYVARKMEERGREKIGEMTQDVHSQAKVLKDELKERERKVKEFKKLMEKFEKMLDVDMEKAREIEDELERIKKSKKELEKELARIEKQEKELEKEERSIIGIIDKKAESIRKMEKELDEFEKLKQKLEKDLQVVLKLARILKKKKPEEITKAMEEIDQVMIEIRKETKKIGEKYYNLQKLLQKLE